MAHGFVYFDRFGIEFGKYWFCGSFNLWLLEFKIYQTKNFEIRGNFIPLRKILNEDSVAQKAQGVL